MAEEDPAETHPLLGNNRLEDIPVYPIIHMIRQVRVFCLLRDLELILRSSVISGHAGTGLNL